MWKRWIPKSVTTVIISLTVVPVFSFVLLPTAQAQRQVAESSKSTFPDTLNEDQKLYMEWTEKQFADYLDQSEYVELSGSAKMELERRWIAILQGPPSRQYYNAINCLATIKSRKALDSLLKIAVDRREKDNRDRWMATRALGIIGDESVVPELIDLVYHYNQNTRFWAQMSLVRLTGQNFGPDWREWRQWWNAQKNRQPVSDKKVQWTSQSQWADPLKQQQVDREFVERLRQSDRPRDGDRTREGDRPREDDRAREGGLRREGDRPRGALCGFNRDQGLRKAGASVRH